MTHHCHWRGCEKEVPPHMWGCKKHWFMLPHSLRARIWDAYRRGQEITMTPSPEYIVVAKEAQEWIAANPNGHFPRGKQTAELSHKKETQPKPGSSLHAETKD